MVSSSNPAASLIIINWNGAQVLTHCLDAVASQTFADFETIIVDNGSEDSSIDGLEKSHPDVQVIKLGKNRGFAFANNVGVREARGKWIGLINNDAYPDPDWLSNLMTAASGSDSAFASFASRLIQSEDPTRLDGAGDVYHMGGLAWRRYHNRPVQLVGRVAEEVFSPCAAAALYSRKAFSDVGGFDEEFFSYHEDVDIGFRLRLQGYRCLYVPNAIVKHVGSASLGRRSSFAIYHGHRNMVWTYLKNMPGPLFWKYLPAALLANLQFLCYYSLKGYGRAIWKAKIDALRGSSAMLQKRREIQRTARVTPADIDRAIDHGWFGPLFRLPTTAR